MCAKLSSGGGAKVAKSPLAPSPYNYKHLMSDPGFLKVKARAQKVQGIDLVAIDFAKNEVRFQVNSVSRPGLRHNIVVQFNSVPAKTVMDRGTHGLATLLRQVGVRVFCSCEAWWYWGFQYKSERRDYNAYKFGLAYPKVRNPKLKGYTCFCAGTQVLTAEGYRPIESIRVGDLVFTHKGRLRPVLACMSQVVDEVGEVSYSKGRVRVRCTGDHQFFRTTRLSYKGLDMPRYTDVSKRAISELGKQDYLVRTALSLNHTIEVDPRLAWFLGLYLSDGGVTRAERCEKSLRYTDSQYTYKAVSIALDIRQWSWYKEELSKRGIKHTRFYRSGQTYSGSFRVSDPEVVAFCVKYGGSTCLKDGTSKTLAAEVFSWSKEAQDALLSGFFAGDGTVLTEGGSAKHRVSTVKFYNTNKQLIESLYILLAQGYYPRLACYTRPSHKVCNRSVASVPQPMYHLTLYGADACKWINSHPNECSLKSTYSTKGVSFGSTQRYFTPDGYRPQSCNYTPAVAQNVRVYNLMVAEDASYLLEDCVAVANCKHLWAVLGVLASGTIMTSIAKKLKDYVSEEQLHQVQDALSRIKDLKKL